MKKYILVLCVGCISMSGIAGKDNLGRANECNNYWKPIIKDLKEARGSLQEEWDNLVPWEQKSNPAIFDMLCKMQNQQYSAENARNICFEKGLQKSKEAYENRW